MKRALYVVDDQAPVLETAVLILKMIDRTWEVTGFLNPLEALEAARFKAPDLILSDQLMPNMQGSQLLEQIRQVSPRTIRIIMSGYVALNKLTLITSAHQYIAKPFDAAKLRDLVKRSFAAQERIASAGLQSIVTGLSSIPSLPQVHQSLLHELEDERTGSTAIARKVADDPGLSQKALQLANSPLFGKGYLITSPVDAVMCLGTDIIAAIILSQSLFKHYETVNRPEMDLKKIWAHSWETACLAQHICRERHLAGRFGEEAFLAGLMHEIGRFILIDNFPDQFKGACDGARNTKAPLVTRLREAMQASPSEVGAYVLELWGLPTSVVTAIGNLDHPEVDQVNGFTMTTALYVADRIASEKFPPDAFAVEPWKMEYLKAAGCAEQLPNWEAFFSRKTSELVKE